MSEQQQNNLNNFPDAKGKTLEEDSEAYERTDSGFISGDISEEIASESEKIIPSSEPIEEEPERVDSMFVDSGVGLSERFSNISLKGLNNLNAPQKRQTTAPVDSAKNAKSQKNLEDIWKTYYEPDEDGDTHLHTAITSGFVEVALALIRAAPHPRFLDTPNDEGETPLHLAVTTGQWRIARWLRVAGCRPGPRDIRGESPLHLAARLNDYMSVRAMAEPPKAQEREQLTLGYQVPEYRTCNFEQWNYLGQTAVHAAAIHGNIEVLRHLVWYGANVNAREGCTGCTALHYAVERRDEDLVQFLLQCPKIDVQIETYGGRSALETTLRIPTKIEQLLKDRGVLSPYISEEEDTSDADDEPMYENAHRYSVPVVNASA